MASGKRKNGGGGERTLEGRHVIGLFLLMLVFSGGFFTLGFVMGRSQYDTDVRAAALDPNVALRNRATTDSPAKKAAQDAKSQRSGPSAPASASDWDFYHAGEPRKSPDHLTPAPVPSTAGKTVAVASKSIAGNSAILNSTKGRSPLNAP